MLHGPVVNLNGATRESLLKQHMEVAAAARALYRALADAGPHGRDYQTAAPGAWSKDAAYHSEMIGQVDRIERTYQRIAERLATEDGA